jgi:selenocysteine-specific elongation factor
VHVIGTAGHVDHGKTTLIEALTGINPDRLPEEKARGMTIDLGFAWFAGQNDEPIGVIDVPGHERFIRNMVAGAWSLDCALLLVAADDGWMQQTQDHAVVLASLDVGSVIIVVTKTDAAAESRVEDTGRDARARCAKIFGAEPPCIAVSALTGKNVGALKELIIRTVSGLPDRGDPRGFPFLYVDRVFTVRGSGLVVTGSLKGAPCTEKDELVLLPQQESVRVRGMQSYNSSVTEARPTSRVALNLQKTRGEIRRGNCITSPHAPFSTEKELVARVRPVEGLQELSEIRNHAEVEIALGTGHVIAQLHFMGDRRVARIQLREPLPALWGQPFLVIRHGGSEILGSGRILWFGEVKKEERRRLAGLIAEMPEKPHDADRFFLELRFNGLARKPKDLSLDADADVESPVLIDEWMFHPPWLEKLTTDILAIAALPAGVASRELESKLRVDGDALKGVLASLVAGGGLTSANNLYFARARPEKSELSTLGRRLLSEIERAGKAGFESTHTGIEGAQRELKTLIRLSLVVPLEGGICYARSVFDELAAGVLAGRTKSERFSIPEAKERTGLSRKYIIPLLNRMEKDGLLKRDGDARVVL